MDLLENGCLKIILTEEDLREFHLTFEDLDYNNENTRNILHQLLDTARHETGFDSSGSLIIEALPVDGGCMLLLTPTGGKRHVRMKRVVGPYIFELEDADTVLRLAQSVVGYTSPMFGSSLYKFDKRYRLVLYPGAPLSREIGNLLGEFARPAGEGDLAAAYTAEHGESIAVGDALNRICAAMNQSNGNSIGY
jgi:negative regulator of genetic competence, sporulation and motility